MVNPNALKILVVDDEPDFAALVATTLRQEGFIVSVAHDGDEALRFVREEKPNLITLDIQMPKKSGLLFYRQLKSEAIYKDIPVVVITGLTRNDRDSETFIRSFLEVEHLPAPNAYIEKPIERETLIRVTNQVLNQTEVKTKE